MMQIFSRPFTIGNAVCHSSKVDKQLKTCNWVFAIYSFMWAAECRIILSEDIRWLPLPTILRVIFGKTLQTVHYIYTKYFYSTCQFIFFTSCQFRLSRRRAAAKIYFSYDPARCGIEGRIFCQFPIFGCLLNQKFVSL